MRWLINTEREDQPTGSRDGTQRAAADTSCGHDVEGTGENHPVDQADLLAAVAREARPAPADRPWVVLNMVASVDGASAGPEHRSGSLSGPADRALFHALRALADVVLAGAQTVRAENYGAPRLAEGAAELRAARGQAPLPRLAVASRTLRLDPAARFFREVPPDQPPIVLTTSTAVHSDAARSLEPVADLRALGDTAVDWASALRLLHHEYDARVVLVEGGPTINGQLVAGDLVDELCLTITPQVVGGDAQRIVVGAPALQPLALRLDRVLEDDGFLLLRYCRPHQDGRA